MAGKKKKIVVVDDEKDFTEVVKEALEKTGRYEVIQANSGGEGIELTKKHHPSLVLLDLMLPDVDGNDVAMELKQNKSTENIPIVFLTAAVTEEETSAREGFIGGNIFLAKPVGIRELVECVDKNVE
ncbi:MAG: response regulator [Candidatus Omnitrophota bacterium]